MRGEKYYAQVRWAASDVQSLRPRWSMEQCEQWLSDNERHIRDRVTELGWEVIECLLPERRRKSEKAIQSDL